MKIANRNVESTPSTILVLTHKGKVIHELRQHWTEKAGLYGYQIVSQMWVTDRNGKEEYSENATSGCGYCKESNSLDNFARSVMGKYVGLGGNVSYFLRGTKYHKGGNYYEMPLSVFKRTIAKNKCAKS